MFAETDFGLVADATLDTTDKASMIILAASIAIAMFLLLAMAWFMRGAF